MITVQVINPINHQRVAEQVPDRAINQTQVIDILLLNLIQEQGINHQNQVLDTERVRLQNPVLHRAGVIAQAQGLHQNQAVAIGLQDLHVQVQVEVREVRGLREAQNRQVVHQGGVVDNL